MVENIVRDKFDKDLGIENTIETVPITCNFENMKIVDKREKDFLDTLLGPIVCTKGDAGRLL